MMRQAIHRDLDLSRHGLLLVPYLGTVNFGDDGTVLMDYADEEAAYNELRRHSPHDAVEKSAPLRRVHPTSPALGVGSQALFARASFCRA